jgi:hypothetical protein
VRDGWRRGGREAGRACVFIQHVHAVALRVMALVTELLWSCCGWSGSGLTFSWSRGLRRPMRSAVEVHDREASSRMF